MTRRRRIKQIIYYVALWLVSLFFFLPIVWVVLNAFKSRRDILAVPPRLFFTPTLENLQDLVARPAFGPYMTASITMSVAAVLIAIMVAFLASYAFSRFKPRGTDFLMFILLSVRMVPGAAVVIPIYMMYNLVGWRENWLGMTLFFAMFSIPFSVWILKGFIDGVSPRFDETAMVNGASRFHTLFRVVLPQVKPGLVAAFIFNLIFVWNDFLFSFMLGGRNTSMIPVLLSTGLYADGGVDWPFVSALTLVYIIPPVIVVFLFQRFLLVGMTFGTVRGEV